MIWQDAILTAGSLVFLVALLPMVVRDGEKPPIATSLPTGLVLLMFAGTYSTLGATFACATTTVAGVMWLTLAVQRSAQSAGTLKSNSGGN